MSSPPMNQGDPLMSNDIGMSPTGHGEGPPSDTATPGPRPGVCWFSGRGECRSTVGSVEEITIGARGFEFPALVAGPADGPLIMMLHGLPRNRWEWHHQIPALAGLGFRVVAPDLRGFSAGARPEGVDSYHVDEYVADVLAIADMTAGEQRPFHLMATSIGASMAWVLAARHASRVLSLVCINIPHPGALAAASVGRERTPDDQRERFSYIREARKEGNERAMFEAMLSAQGVAPAESEPYRRALDDDDVLRTVFHYYRALPLWARDRVEPVSVPTTFIWPTGSDNVSPAAIEAMPKWVTGSYALHVVEDVHQPVLQAAPEVMIELLVAHLAQHA